MACIRDGEGSKFLSVSVSQLLGRSALIGAIMCLAFVNSTSGHTVTRPAAAQQIQASVGERRVTHGSPRTFSRRKFLAAGAASVLHLGLGQQSHAAEPNAAPRGIYVERFESVRTIVSNRVGVVDRGETPRIALKLGNPLGIFRIDPSTKTAVRVMPPAAVISEQIHLSPDGQYLVFLKRDSTLNLHNLITQKTVERDDLVSWFESVARAPDSRRLIAMTRHVEHQNNLNLELLQIGTAAGETVIETIARVPDPPSIYRAPLLSPDGQHIAYEQGARVTVGRADLPLQIPAVQPRGVDVPIQWDPQWSPRGDQLLLLGREGTSITTPTGPAVIYLTGIDELRPVRITTELLPETPLYAHGITTWSPDGQHIAYQARAATADASPLGEVFMHTLAAATSRQLTHGSNFVPIATHRALHWSADGHSIFFVQSPERLPFTYDPSAATPQNNIRVTELAPHRVDVASGTVEKLAEGFADLIIGVH